LDSENVNKSLILRLLVNHAIVTNVMLYFCSVQKQADQTKPN